MIYEFDCFRLDTVTRQLFRYDQTIKLSPKEFDILLLLVKNHGKLVSKEILLAQIWPDQHVEENNLTVRISRLRKALKEGPKATGYIQNSSGHGYRFTSRVSIHDEIEETPNQGDPPDRHHKVYSIAVLPFGLFSSSAKDEYLGQGIADALTTKLCKIKRIKVAPTSTILNYARSNRAPAFIGRALGVDLILSGQVQKAGHRIRVSVQLIETGEWKLLWADKFDEDFTHIFSVEDSISERVAYALVKDLTLDEQRSINQRHTNVAEAYQLYLKGRYSWNKRTDKGLIESVQYYQQAIKIDPGYALAYSGLADSYALLSDYGVLPPHEAMPNAKAAAEKALAIDSQLAEANVSLAFVTAHYEWNWLKAEEQSKRAIRLNPNYSTAHTWYAIQLLVLGRFDECMQEMKRAHELEPLSLIITANIGFCLYFTGQYDLAIEKCYEVLKQDFSFAVAHLYLGLVFGQKGMLKQGIDELKVALNLSGEAPEVISALGYTYAIAGNHSEALKLINKLKKLSRRRYVSKFNCALIHFGLGEVDEGFRWVEKAYDDRADMLPYIKVDPRLQPLRRDLRFKNLIARIGLEGGLSQKRLSLHKPA